VPAVADDYAALALGSRDLDRATKDPEAAKLTNKLLVQMATRYFDPSTSTYFGALAPLAPGFFMRPAASEDPPTAASMSLPARAIHATALAAQLSESLDETSIQAPGDQLLALAFFSGEGPVR